MIILCHFPMSNKVELLDIEKNKNVESGTPFSWFISTENLILKTKKGIDGVNFMNKSKLFKKIKKPTLQDFKDYKYNLNYYDNDGKLVTVTHSCIGSGNNLTEILNPFYVKDSLIVSHKL